MTKTFRAHYHQLKARHRDQLLIMQDEAGSYQALGPDAEVLVAVLGSIHAGDAAWIPARSLNAAIGRLLDAGHEVALAEPIPATKETQA